MIWKRLWENVNNIKKIRLKEFFIFKLRKL